MGLGDRGGPEQRVAKRVPACGTRIIHSGCFSTGHVRHTSDFYF